MRTLLRLPTELKSNPPAFAAFWIIAAYALTAFAGYLIAPDNSANANRQLPELARLPPGATARVVKIPVELKEQRLFQIWYEGDRSVYRYDVLPNGERPRLENGKLIFRNKNGYIQQISVDSSNFNGMKPATAEAFVENLRFPLGTDNMGRDLLSRLIIGCRVSLKIGLLAVLVTILLGTSVGAAAGYYGGWTDRALQWFMTVIWSVPTLLLAVALAFALGKGERQLFLAIGLGLWVELARVARGQTIELKTREFAQAARAAGLPNRSIILRHILPNLTGTIIILSCVNFSTAILLEAGLSFLGLGVSPPAPSWGRMIFEGYSFLALSYGKQLAIFPGIAVALLILSLNTLALGLKDVFEAK